jgi:hypothetical protein
MEEGFIYDKAVMTAAVWGPEIEDTLFKKLLCIQHPHGTPLHIIQEFFT